MLVMAGILTEGKCGDCRHCFMTYAGFDNNGLPVDAVCNSNMGPEGPIDSTLSPYRNLVRDGRENYANRLNAQGKTCFGHK